MYTVRVCYVWLQGSLRAAYPVAEHGGRLVDVAFDGAALVAPLVQPERHRVAAWRTWGCSLEDRGRAEGVQRAAHSARLHVPPRLSGSNVAMQRMKCCAVPMAMAAEALRPAGVSAAASAASATKGASSMTAEAWDT